MASAEIHPPSGPRLRHFGGLPGSAPLAAMASTAIETAIPALILRPLSCHRIGRFWREINPEHATGARGVELVRVLGVDRQRGNRSRPRTSIQLPPPCSSIRALENAQ